MGQLEDLKVFAKVVDTGSISQASEALNVAKSAISRRINLLEERYGVRLIDREPGVWRVTPTGQELYQRAIRLVTEMDEIESDFKDESQHLAGPLTVSIPSDFGFAFLTPQLTAFKKTYPDILLTLDFDDRKVDLQRENYDFALRIGSEIETGHKAEKIGSACMKLCASPAYLEARGVPRSIEELKKHALLNFGTARRATWEFETSAGRVKSVEFQPVLNSNSGTFLVTACEQGLGICFTPDFLCQKSVAKGNLCILELEDASKELGIYLIHAENRRLNKRMRLFAKEMQLACF